METHVPVKVQSLRDPHEGGGHRKAGREVASAAVAACVSCGAGGPWAAPRPAQTRRREKLQCRAGRFV